MTICLAMPALSQMSPIRICGAEFAATRWEVREWIETGKVSVVQPDITRCGGLTEIRRIADMCELYGVQVIPHGWKTGILAAAGATFRLPVRMHPISSSSRRMSISRLCARSSFILSLPSRTAIWPCRRVQA